jgi:hypothetical protein
MVHENRSLPGIIIALAVLRMNAILQLSSCHLHPSIRVAQSRGVASLWEQPFNRRRRAAATPDHV